VAFEVVIPMLGITVEKGRIVEWLKQEGDYVEKREIIFIVEVEKAITEVESPASGILAKILIPVGVEVAILTVAAVITAPGEVLPEKYKTAQPVTAAAKWVADAAREPSPKEIPLAPNLAATSTPAMPAAQQKAKELGIRLVDIKGTGPEGIILLRDVESVVQKGQREAPARVSTLARKMAEKEGVPLGKIAGTGVRGRIMRTDVLTYAEREKKGGAVLGTKIPMSTVRKVVARRMSESAFAAPHIYFFTEVWMDPLLKYRDEVVADFENRFDLRPSINDFLIKAVALNIIDFPMLNAQLQGDEIHFMPEINIGLAVAVEEGLVVPAIARADRAGLLDIIRQRADLVERARKGRLTISEMERGTFTVSSLAQYDITHFTAILNPPQSGILSVSKANDKLVLVDGQVKTSRVTRLGLSVDHRIIDGAVAADFLQNLKWKLERPASTFIAL
jgi:pyruvate dehydrogenase E2 component (dihydrolipoamide acetyltransferase)